MQNQAVLFLDSSEEVKEILQQQEIDIYQVIQEELPNVQSSIMADPLAPSSEKGLAEVIITTLPFMIYAITPIVIRTLNQFKPDTTEVRTKVTETHHPDGTVTIHRISVSIQRQYNQQAPLVPPTPQAVLPPTPKQEN